MNLKYRRNYPTIIILLSILATLAIGMGEHPIIAYIAK
jgi:hypothetical protein